MEIRLFSSACMYLVIYCLSSISLAYAEYCIEYGHSCVEPHKCCGPACCIPSDLEEHYRNHLRWSVWNMWYFWFVVLFVLMSCFGGCSYYRRHQLMVARQQGMIGTVTEEQYPGWRFSPSFPISLFSSYSARNQHQRVAQVERTTEPIPQVAATVFPSPPAYSEVMSRPEVYPPSKDNDLPPYPGTDAQGIHSPPGSAYAGPVVQLPPYTPAILSNQTTAIRPHSNQPVPGNQSTARVPRSTVSTDNCPGYSVVDSVRGSSGAGTTYDCTTQTVSGI